MTLFSGGPYIVVTMEYNIFWRLAINLKFGYSYVAFLHVLIGKGKGVGL